MNTLQNHYGMAIRQNTNNLYSMKKAIAAVLHHSTEHTTLEVRHRFCPRTENSWCKFQKDKITGENTYKENITIDKAVSEIIAPVFSHSDLGNDELLKKCMHGQTQNVNESLNNVIWTRCPKRVYVGNSTFKTAVASAVIAYNDGSMGLFPVFEKCGIEIGHFTRVSSEQADKKRIKHSNRKSTDKVKSRRKRLRGIKKGYREKEELEEGQVYGYGMF